MIIRSQNKKAIANFDNIDSIGVERNHCGCDVVGFNGTRESCVKLGEYSTEEKVIKVLDMIQSAYNSIETMKIDKKAWRDNHYFQMPQDNKVEV